MKTLKKTRKASGGYTAWNKGLTKEDERVRKNVENSQTTLYQRYGITNPGQLPHETWNKGLTKETDERMKKASEHHKGIEAWNKGKSTGWHWTADTFQKRYETQLRNGTLGQNHNTKAENEFYQYLLSMYDPEDIVQQYYDRERYPFKCDFYIKSEDLFIELHSNWEHGGRPFNANDPECQKQLQIWQEKAKNSKYYANAIYQCTDLDIRKVETAKRNNLNFMVLYPDKYL